MKETRLRNVLFPIWLLFLIPQVWLIILPFNFIVDSAVMLIALYKFGEKTEMWRIWRRYIWPVWLFGFVADAIGGLLLFGVSMLDEVLTGTASEWFYDNITQPISINPLSSLLALIVILIAVAIAGLLIYVLNSRVSFRKMPVEPETRHRLALVIAIFTAPWTYFIPSQWIW